MSLWYQQFCVRDWQPQDRSVAAAVIEQVLAEYGLDWEPEGADQDVIEVETHYLQREGRFWVVEKQIQNDPVEIVGTAAYYPTARGVKSVEIRKMYLLPEARGQGLGSFLLHALEQTIAQQGYQEIWVETASVLKEAVFLYERRGYLPETGVETSRCDRIYRKLLTA
jgi:putative acetyltransferase